jgi:hypothetical protein
MSKFITAAGPPRKLRGAPLLLLGILMMLVCTALPLKDVRAQVGNVGIGTTAPDNSALLDMTSTSMGLLIPRVTATQMNAIAAPATALLVFNTTANTFYYYDGTQWVPFLVANTAWKLTGNSGTSPGTNFIGTIDSIDWIIKTNSRERLRVTADGKTIIKSNNNASKQLQFQTPNGSYTTSFQARAQPRGDIKYILPDTAGGTFTVLTNTGTDTLFWSPPGSKGITWSTYTMPSFASDRNDYSLSPTDYVIYRVTSTAANVKITGIAGGYDGRFLIIVNVGSNAITIANQSSASATANQFLLGGGNNFSLGGDQACLFFYDAISTAWRPLSKSP